MTVLLENSKSYLLYLEDFKHIMLLFLVFFFVIDFSKKSPLQKSDKLVKNMYNSI